MLFARLYCIGISQCTSICAQIGIQVRRNYSLLYNNTWKSPSLQIILEHHNPEPVSCSMDTVARTHRCHCASTFATGNTNHFKSPTYVMARLKWNHDSNTNVLSETYRSNIGQAMLKHTKSKKEIQKNEQQTLDEEFVEYGDDTLDLENVHFEDDADFPPRYREMTGHMKNLRIDSIIKFALAMKRSTVEDYFLASKLKLNGERVLKKSKQVAEGDCIDVITDHHDGNLTVKRVRIVQVKNQPDSDRATVYFRVWRAGVDVPVIKDKFKR